MKTNTNCTELILKGNEITNADCAHIKTLLATNKSLTTLNLEANKIDSEGSILIAEGIKANTTLTTLILLGNGPFGESCMDAWLDAFTDNITLVDRPSEIDARWSWRCHVLQDDVSSSPPLQKPVETVLVRPRSRRRPQVHVKWRLDSRKSFKLNKDITRNNTILKWKAEGKDWESWLPDHLKPEKPAAAGGAAAEAQAEPDIEKKIAAVTVSD